MTPVMQMLRNFRGVALAMVIIWSMILSIIGMAIIYLNNMQEIKTRQEIVAARALFLSDAGIDLAKAHIVACGDHHNVFPENRPGHSADRAAYEVANETLETSAAGYFPEGVVRVSVDPYDTNNIGVVGDYLVVSSGIVTSGISGSYDTYKVEHVVIRMSSMTPSGYRYKILRNTYQELPLARIPR